MQNVTAMNAAALPCAPHLVRYSDLLGWLNVTRPTLQRYSQEPGFPRRLKLGRTLYVDEAEAREWVARKLGEPTKGD